jgi:hypothetical protein
MKKLFNNNSSALIIIIPIIIILFPFAYSIFSHTLIKDTSAIEPFLQMPDPKYKECVRDTEYMRHHHWELLRAVREEFVRHGKRGEISLSRCKDCHTSRMEFCNKCHSAVSMQPDCYGCHYYP